MVIYIRLYSLFGVKLFFKAQETYSTCSCRVCFRWLSQPFDIVFWHKFWIALRLIDVVWHGLTDFWKVGHCVVVKSFDSDFGSWFDVVLGCFKRHIQ